MDIRNFKIPACYSFFLTISIFCFACNDPIKKEIDHLPQQKIVEEKPKTQAKDIDSYFIENQTTQGAPRGITRNIIQDKSGKLWFASFEGIFEFDGKSFYNRTNIDSLKRFRAFSLLEAKDGKIWFGTIGAGVYLFDPTLEKQGISPWKRMDKTNGLVHNSVLSFFQDSQDNIWIGTMNGVSCYNGNSFKNYTKEDGMIDADINGMTEDRDGKIWFAARGYAFTFDGASFKMIRTKEGKPFLNVRSIIKDSKGNIWLGGRDGLWRYDGKSFKDFKTNFIGYIYEDSKGSIWVSEGDPHNTYNMCLQKYDMHKLDASAPKSAKVTEGNGQVFGITEDQEGNIWFGLEGGICKYDGIQFNFFEE